MKRVSTNCQIDAVRHAVPSLLFELSLNSRMNPSHVGLNISLTGPEGGLRWLKMFNTFGIIKRKETLT